MRGVLLLLALLLTGFIGAALDRWYGGCLGLTIMWMTTPTEEPTTLDLPKPHIPGTDL